MDITYDLLFVTRPMEHQTSSAVNCCKARDDTKEAGIKAGQENRLERSDLMAEETRVNVSFPYLGLRRSKVLPKRTC